MAIQDLQQFNSIISTPFITVSFGGEVFGLTDRINRRTQVREIKYVTALEVLKKASGTVNTYSLSMSYVVEPGSDPNYIDYIISQSQDRSIVFTYGDMSQPEFTYVREQAIITKIAPQVAISSNTINYTIQATSSVAINYSLKRTYPAREHVKPSDIIYEILYTNKEYGLLDLFQGMRDREWVELNNIIARNDEPVRLEAIKDLSPLEYIRVLVSRMHNKDNSFYAMIIHDEISLKEGFYFSVINSNLHQGKGSKYSLDIDVGYPSDTPVYSFTPSQDTSLALITPYQEKFDAGRIININNAGEMQTSNTPSIAVRNGIASAQLQQWWKSMTSYPINATLVTRGLVRPSILCDYLQINVLFFGQRYNYSGYYMVTAQRDNLSASGYTTELSLIRVEGDK